MYGRRFNCRTAVFDLLWTKTLMMTLIMRKLKMDIVLSIDIWLWRYYVVSCNGTENYENLVDWAPIGQVPFPAKLNDILTVKLAYCMTYNKSQGQTLNKCLVDSRSEPFTHGHLYVALSRIPQYRVIYWKRSN